MLKISVIGGRTQPRDPGRQASRVARRGARDRAKDGQEGGQRARFYAYGKTKVTWTLRIVFLLWLVVSIALILTSIARLYHCKTRGMGMKKTKASGNPELRIDSIKLPMRWHAGCRVAPLEGLRSLQETSSHIASFQRRLW